MMPKNHKILIPVKAATEILKINFDGTKVYKWVHLSESWKISYRALCGFRFFNNSKSAETHL